MSSGAFDPAADLLASLRATRAGSEKSSPAPTANPYTHQLPSESAVLPSHSVKSPSSAHVTPSIEKMSRHTTPGPQAPPNLLGLLKFGQPATSPQPTPPQHSTPQTSLDHGRPSASNPHGRGISASDLVSSLVGGTPPIRERTSTPSSAGAHQNSLLKLLNQTVSNSQKSPQPDSVAGLGGLTQNLPQSSPAANENARPTPDRTRSPIHYFGSKESTPISFEPHGFPKASPFQPGDHQEYSNPFEPPSESTPNSKKLKASPNGEEVGKHKSPSAAAFPQFSQTIATSTTPKRASDASIAARRIAPVHSPNPAKTKMGSDHSKPKETVTVALQEVGNTVDRQVENALAEAETSVTIKQEQDEDQDKNILHTVNSHVSDPIKHAVGANAAEGNLDPATTLTNETDHLNDSEHARAVKVYQFPMRPFVAIDLVQKDKPNLNLREQADLPVARFKKDFDQADRSLGTATTEFIVYAMPKPNGGVRVIDQDNGASSLIFPETQDRAFNVAISTAGNAQSQGPQNVIATGISGTVYWTTISEDGAQLSQEEMRKRSVYFLPTPTGSDSTSGGQLKTRAKKSSRHPEYFAIGRGKSIQIVFPAHAGSSEFLISKNTLNTEKYFASRSLKITTGKAGKDFTFSEDDSVIATLDKAGKLRLWDIRELTDEANASASRLAPIEVKSPLWTFATIPGSSSEKQWPTSVLFVDKLRPYTKGCALRYIIVGMKQNHTLQLWDLCLGKAVQEVNFSHENETDAICSIAYHPGTGIIVVGHPTRNSIYFIHLSAPRYNLPNISQAKFAQRLVNKDATLPKADSTAIMSGMREYSLADKGQLRSIEITQTIGDGAIEGDEEPSVFELVVMHSKGVLCLSMKKEDLGWSQDNKVLHPIDAEQSNVILVKDLKEVADATGKENAAAANGDPQASPSPSKPLSQATSKEDLKSNQSSTTTPAREGDKKKSKKSGTSDASSSTKSLNVPKSSDSYANALQKGSSPKPQAASTLRATSPRPSLSKHASTEAPEASPASSAETQIRATPAADSVNVGISSDFLNKEIKKIEQAVSNEFSKVLGKELDSLYKRTAEDKRVQDAAGAAKQDAILRLVSSTLGDNVEKSLSRIVQKSIQENVLPSVESSTAATLTKQLPTLVAPQLQSAVSTAVKQSLSETLTRTLKSPDVIKSMSDDVSRAISGHIERELTTVLNKIITPAFQNLALSIAQKISGETESRVRDQLRQFDQQRRNDSAKIDQLTTLVTSLSDMVHTMAAAQSQFQAEILKLQQKTADNTPGGAQGHSPTPSESASMHVSPEQEEVDAITATLNEGRVEEATVMWLQSSNQARLFDAIFTRLSPGYLARSSPLLVLSVGAAVTLTMETHIEERLGWLEVVLATINPSEYETRDIGGRILDVLTQRLESGYMRIAENDSSNSALRKIAALTKQAKELRKAFP